MGEGGTLMGRGLVPPLQGKPNKKKLVRVYNEAYKQICSLWNLLPQSAKMSVPTDEDENNEMQVDEEPSQDISRRKINIQLLESQVKLLKGKQASYKEKMAKNKLKKNLRKKKKLEERQVMKQEMKKKRKLLKLAEKDKKMAQNDEGNHIMTQQDESPNKTSHKNKPDKSHIKEPKTSHKTKAEKSHKIKPETSHPTEVEEDMETEQQEVVKTKKSKKNKKKALIEEKLQLLSNSLQDSEEPGLSKKKLKLKIKNDLKAEKKREKKKLIKLKKKEELGAVVTVKCEVPDDVKPTLEKTLSEPVEILFNKMDLDSDKKRFKKEKSKIEKDPVKALEKLEELNKKISDLKESGLEDKAAAIKSRHSWKTALLKAEGVKVKDDVKLLKKTIKRQENKKSKSQTEWKKRTEMKEKRMSDAQNKRKQNISKKNKEKKQKKIKRSIKKGRVVI